GGYKVFTPVFVESNAPLYTQHIQSVEAAEVLLTDMGQLESNFVLTRNIAHDSNRVRWCDATQVV
ncbi:hypothetical protein SARC_18089, partial [Sphaeroforma arctica JP610]